MMNKIKSKIWAQLFIIYTRYLIGGAFVFASLIKIKGHRFTSDSGAGNPINTAWHFFETMYQSGLYWKFIGLGQLVAGFFLMTQKYAKLGAVMFFPIIANVFVITLSYDFNYTPVITGLMLLANILLLIWDWNELKILFNLTPVIDEKKRLEHDQIWQVIGLLLFLFTFIYRVAINQYNMVFWFGVCVLIGLGGLILGWRRNKKNQETSFL